MYDAARKSGKKTWQTRRHLVSVEAALAIQRENVMNRLLQLRAEIGHPEKHDKPLPQDQAAARAGVTVRQWQRWESGQSVPYARNLSEVADAFGFDVSEFYDGPAGREAAPTPTPFADRPSDARILELLETVQQLVLNQNELLARQSAILDRIEDAVRRDDEVRDEIADLIRDRGREIVQGRPRATESSPPQGRPRPADAKSPRAAKPRTR